MASIKKQYQYANKDKNKSRNQLMHLLRRFQERFNISIGVGDIDDMLKSIKSNNATLLAFSYKGVVYRTKCRDVDVVIVVSTNHKHILTVYPKDSQYYNKESNKHYSDLPSLKHLIYLYRQYLELNYSNNLKIFCEKCKTNKVYIEVNNATIVCTKCGYSFDLTTLAT